MLMRCLKRCTLYGVPAVSLYGTETRTALGEIRAAFVSRSAEETMEDDAERALETVYAVIPARYAPLGGFRRSMVLDAGGAEYRMLTPVDLGTLWSVKCVRVHQ